MDYKYEYMFFRYLYELLELNKLDEKMQLEKIKMIDEDHASSRISKYFSLLNDGNDEEFDENEKKEYEKIFSNDLNVLMNNYLQVVEFVKKTYKKFFHLNDEVDYKYYGPISDEFIAPTDCIVIGLNYNKFDIDSENYDMEQNRQEKVVVSVLNYIQNELSKKHGIKIATLSFNEITLNEPFVKI